MRILNHHFLHSAKKKSKVIFCIAALFTTLFVASIFIQSCKKDKGSTSVKPANNLQGVNSVIQVYANEYGEKRVTEASKRLINKDNSGFSFSPISKSALALSSIDINSTTEINKFTDAENEEYHIFLTDYKATANLNGGVVSVLLPNQRLLSYVAVIENTSQDRVVSNVYSLSGEEVGTLEFLNGSMVNSTISAVPTLDPLTIQIRKWIKCSKECVRETVLVCASDPHCFLMYSISNAPIPGSKIPGTKLPAIGGGTAALGIACGIMCMKDVRFDVLPIVAEGSKPAITPNYGPLKPTPGLIEGS
ncbi:MAG: hypothetical protein ACTHLE_20700 [Agriterribacter sp.]